MGAYDGACLSGFPAIGTPFWFSFADSQWKIAYRHFRLPIGGLLEEFGQCIPILGKLWRTWGSECPYLRHPLRRISGSMIGNAVVAADWVRTPNVPALSPSPGGCSVLLVLLASVLAAGGIATRGVWALVGAVLVLAIVWRSWRLRVDDLGYGVRIVSWTRTLEVPWDEIDRFEFDGGVSLRRRDLRTVPLSTFSLPPVTCSASRAGATMRPSSRSNRFARSAASRPRRSRRHALDL
jgi:hypothetical protein